jgi:hypothetical protein
LPRCARSAEQQATPCSCVDAFSMQRTACYRAIRKVPRAAYERQRATYLACNRVCGTGPAFGVTGRSSAW